MTTRERDAWTFAYRFYDEYAPKMREAAKLDDNNETAGQLFLTALERVKQHYSSDNDDANSIYLRVFDLLDDVFKSARRQL